MNGVSGLTRWRRWRGSCDGREDHEREFDAQEKVKKMISRSGVEQAVVRELVKAVLVRGGDLTGPDGLLESITAIVLGKRRRGS